MGRASPKAEILVELAYLSAIQPFLVPSPFVAVPTILTFPARLTLRTPRSGIPVRIPQCRLHRRKEVARGAAENREAEISTSPRAPREPFLLNYTESFDPERESQRASHTNSRDSGGARLSCCHSALSCSITFRGCANHSDLSRSTHPTNFPMSSRFGGRHLFFFGVSAHRAGERFALG